MYRYKKDFVIISPFEARQLLMSNSNILLLDVRTPEEYITGHLPGSVNIPLQVLEWQIMNMQINPYIPVIVYCKTGIRAASAASILAQRGFQTIYSFGGIQNWPYEIVSSSGW